MSRSRKSDAVKVAELELLKALLTNPAVTFVGGFILLETMQKNKVTGNAETSVAEVALGAISIGQALAPLAPAATELAKGLTKNIENAAGTAGLAAAASKALPALAGL